MTNTLNFEKACQILSCGDLVVMPTETVYGLAADATQGMAVAKIYELKSRPSFNPLIIHVDTLDHAQQWGVFSEEALKVAEEFWHCNLSPLTVVVPIKKDTLLSSLVTAGLESVAIRVPSHPVALSLLKIYQRPLAAPSANRSTHISPTTARAVQKSFGRQTPFLLEGGACTIGLESTILDLTTKDPTVLRPGATTVEMLESILQKPVRYTTDKAIKAPGMMKRHYAPNLSLRLNCLQPEKDEAFLGFGDQGTRKPDLNLSAKSDLKEAAANLFSMMLALDRAPFRGIAVAPIPFYGIGVALNDRLVRAATPSDPLPLGDALHPQA